ncbi:MAG: peptide chain release factor N(5)-glutamine methyltransferase [Flavobacteriaceae bacterium]|nr:peptide chain release factor N(5)-glutamine methyltransferase [Flavobacteriaceae bacterium]MBL6870527.1 peptide chain release factor N(5)-glutamine methyltransferase [Flavobacteriaceae bacterium]
MTLLEARDLYRETLQKKFSIGEIDFYFKSLMTDSFQREPTQLALEPESELEPREVLLIQEAATKLLKDYPLQYITGTVHFRTLKLKVDPRVLIPRPETEELVDWIVEDFGKSTDDSKDILDMGTGSGCIAIALAKENTQFTVSALDQEQPILDLAQENALNNGVQIHFFQQDLLQLDSIKQSFDILVSNPPYVMRKEQELMQPNVLDHEPHQALFVPDEDPLVFYRAILKFASLHLNSEGIIYFEINPLLIDELRFLIQQFDYTISERMDIFGKVRMLRLKKK